MDIDLHNIEPTGLWRHFDALRQIPRCSGNEAAAAAYVVSVAERNNLAYERDALGNVVVRRPASEGAEDAPAVVLQSHLDMVCEKDAGVEHDFARDPLALALADGWLTAQGTTLGADNGIGVAAALAVLEDPALTHGPLEALFTIDEERGLTGAKALADDFIAGQILLNLDGDQSGVLFVGCAGGGDTLVSLPITRAEPVDTALSVTVTGLLGGHSGIDIDKGRGNAIRILAQLLYRLRQQEPIRLIQLEGGNKANAIPREASAQVTLPEEQVGQVRQILQEQFVPFKERYAESDPDLTLLLASVAVEGRPLSTESVDRALGLLLGYPVGVLAMSREMPGLVETSNNLATVHTQEGTLAIGLSSRSSQPQALDELLLRLRALSEAAGASVEQPSGYPAWKPDLDAPLLQLVSLVYEATFGAPPAVRAVHAGVEPAIIGKQHPEMEMISIGPSTAFAHSPRERVSIQSVQELWQLLTATLARLAEERGT